MLLFKMHDLVLLFEMRDLVLLFKMRTLGDQIQEGDVLLSNHPRAGGSHLPDLTVITPVSICTTLL